MNGRRSQVVELRDFFGAEGQRIHDRVMAWRNQHVAHRVSESREWTEARAILDGSPLKVKAVRVKAAPAGGREEEEDDLATRFSAYIKQLRDLAWKSGLCLWRSRRSSPRRLRGAI
jgi:hypothetical protein